MATHPKFGGKQRPGKTPAPEVEVKLSDLLAEESAAEDTTGGKEPAESPRIIEAAVEAAPQPVEAAPEPEPFAFEAALVVVEPRAESRGHEQKSEISAWPFNAFELWTESANAFLDFTEELGKAKTLCDVMALQSKFASERYDSFMKHTNEIAEATRRLATQAGFPLPQGFVAVFTA